MPTASVTMWTIVWVNWMPAGCAMAQEKSMNADVLTSRKTTATVTGTNLTPWACAAGTVQRTKMPTASVTMWTTV